MKNYFHLGHRNPEVVEALIDASRELDVGNHHFTGITKALLAEQLTALCPEGLDYAYFSTCGGEAIFLCQGEPGMFVQVPKDDLEAMEEELRKEDTACVREYHL